MVMNKSDYKNKAKLLMDDTAAYKVVEANPLSVVVSCVYAFLLHKEHELMTDKPTAQF